MKNKLIIAVFIIFILLTAIFYTLNIYAPEYHFLPLETGNGIMAALSVITWLIVINQMNNANPQAFVRGVYSASFLKMMVCMISILVYVLLNRANIHKPSIFILFGIYAVYTIMETWQLSKLVRDK